MNATGQDSAAPATGGNTTSTGELDGAGEARGEVRLLRRTALIGAVLVVVALLGYLFAGGRGEHEFVPPDLPYADGTLSVIETDRLVLNLYEPLGDRDSIEFVITPENAGNFDIAHMRTHSSLAIPTRIYYEKAGETYVGVVKTDAPLNVGRA